MNRRLKKVFPVLRWWPMVTRATVRDDVQAGITNAVVVLPQGVAFAMIAGMPPIYGLYTAMVVPIVAALFGSSFHLISGPTTAISIVVFSAISGLAEPGTERFIELALVLTFLAGAFQFLLGIARLGTLVNFVSHSVVVGFTSGAAILIATSQLRHVFGLDQPRGLDFHEKWQFLIANIPDTNLYVLLIAMVTMVTAILVKKFTPKIPHMLVAMVVGSALNYYLDGASKGVAMVVELPSKLPPFRMPELTLDNIELLSSNAAAIALLGLIEAVAIARSIATKSHQNLDGNQEFIGQGLSNIIGSMFSSYAGSGSFTRSGINYQSGAKTPLSAVFAAISLALILLLIAPLTAYLPIPAMGGIILLVAYNLIDVHHIKQIAKTSKSELSVLLVTFLATLFLHLEFAIYLGVILSMIFYLQKTSKPRIVQIAPNPLLPGRHFQNAEDNELTECPQMVILRVDGSLFFGAVEHVNITIDELTDQGVKNILIIGNGINFIDLAGAELLANQAKKIKAKGGGFYLCGLKKKVREVLNSGGYDDTVGKDNIFINKESAISEIYKRLDRHTCDTCEARIFKECTSEM
ncbi:MAG TPA: sodium-independent anion transporter [Flavobacteriales bacterium]|jgi:SulP family sulfate permease|nr:sodium-independent anion transporter [Flavobacteriales bacterium]